MTTSFGAKSTTEDVLQGVDLTGKRVLVTGVSAGLGIETARALAAHGAIVVGAARDLVKAGAALDAAISNKAVRGRISLVELDLASLASARAAADKLIAANEKFDVVIANAGVMACPQGTTKDGFETQFGTNHLGHFVFVNRIAPLIKEGGRFVSLASSGHRFSDVDLDDPNFERTTYEPFLAYGRSKTANVLFAVEFDRRHKARGVRAAAVHPGGIQTELGRHMTDDMRKAMLERVTAARGASGVAFEWKTIPQGAATSVWTGFVARAEDVGARYCEDCHVAELVEGGSDPLSSMSGVRRYALDGEHAKALWAKSEEMVGERF